VYDAVVREGEDARLAVVGAAHREAVLGQVLKHQFGPQG
jgi:hypothetical protein